MKSHRGSNLLLPVTDCTGSDVDVVLKHCEKLTLNCDNKYLPTVPSLYLCAYAVKVRLVGDLHGIDLSEQEPQLLLETLCELVLHRLVAFTQGVFSLLEMLFSYRCALLLPRKQIRFEACQFRSLVTQNAFLCRQLQDFPRVKEQ
ncbi:hypothetical protein PINS_up008714 [Pythium insidiosum]|nr:hypothetical protein PINS_up008714 [Pythium insidiosum]